MLVFQQKHFFKETVMDDYIEDDFGKGLLAVVVFFGSIAFFGDVLHLEQLWGVDVPFLWPSIVLAFFTLLLTEGGGIRLLIFLVLGIICGESGLYEDTFRLVLLDIAFLLIWVFIGFEVIARRVRSNLSVGPIGNGNEGRQSKAKSDALCGIGYRKKHWLN